MNYNKDLPDAPWIADVERNGLPDSDMNEKESYKPEICSNNGVTWWYVCGYCGRPVDVGEDVCPFCEMGVKWDD